MDYFNLPPSTKVNRVIPKNAFEKYTNTKQQKLFTDKINRITWLSKLSKETTNLETKEIQEIQIFRIELKTRETVPTILDIIDRSIPYPIIFIIEFDHELYVSCSAKHPHPVNEDNSVIDWVFISEWINIQEKKYAIHLKENLDSVLKNFCIQLTGNPNLDKAPLERIVNREKELDQIKKDIIKLKSTISKTKQFNQKVEFNEELNGLKRRLHNLRESFNKM